MATARTTSTSAKAAATASPTKSPPDQRKTPPEDQAPATSGDEVIDAAAAIATAAAQEKALEDAAAAALTQTTANIRTASLAGNTLTGGVPQFSAAVGTGQPPGVGTGLPPPPIAIVYSDVTNPFDKPWDLSTKSDRTYPGGQLRAPPSLIGRNLTSQSPTL